MNTVKTLLLVLLLLNLASATSAQSPRRRRATRPVTAKTAAETPAQPAATTSSSEPAPAPVLLATVNGQNITTAEIDPKVREEVEGLETRIAAARRQILELQINTLLLESEASKRKLTPQQLYNIEVAKKIADPAAAEVNKFIENNRDQIEETDPVAMRQQVVAYLRGEHEAKLSEELVKRLRATNAVVISAQNTSNLPPSTVVATVAGRPITAGKVNERLKPIAYKLRLQTYMLEQPALDLTINDLLLLAEANRRNVPPEEIVRKEITEKMHQPTEDEIAKFYSGNRTRLPGELAAVRNQIASYLQDEDRQRLERAVSDRLRKGADIRLLISEPEPPVQSISLDDDPVRGDATAAVTIVEFTDFQCPACAAMQPVLEEVLKSYGSKVRLVVRDFPLQHHTNARKAAEAANAANAQGKFFEYTALLFRRQNALDVPSLKKYASELGLDRARFDAELDSGKYAAEVKHDIDEGQMYGVENTPTIFVNGITLRDLSAEALRGTIDRALARSNSTPKVSAK
ncbi:MAG: thioredoxin domain-containing protein [Acidobacteriota bacterium]|nr:thioredoxin domain-containing protein [Acidobacteriota bacterium]